MKLKRKNFESLLEVHGAVSKCHDFYPDVNLLDYLYPSSSANQVVVKEQGDTFEMAVFLNNQILDEIKAFKLPEDFDLDRFSILSVIIEELSHFNTLYWSALNNESISPLELETQAEVDKFTVALDWLESTKQQNLREKVFDILFSDLKVGAWVPLREENVYKEAHLLAKDFCRRILKERLTGQQKQKLSSKFFRLSGTRKLSFSF